MLHMFAIIFKCFQVFFLQVFHKYVSSVSSVFFRTLQVLYLDFFKSRSSKCSGSPSGWCGSDFRRCFSTPEWLVAPGRPRPYSSGQRRLEAALEHMPPARGPVWGA
jgi:hypothetical protein